MAEQFTPGPWIVHPLVARVDCQKVSDKGGLLPVCQMLWPTDERTEQETESNARLIASAPALYEALDAAYNDRAFVQLDPTTAYKMDAALKQARGEA